MNRRGNKRKQAESREAWLQDEADKEAVGAAEGPQSLGCFPNLPNLKNLLRYLKYRFLGFGLESWIQ